MNGDVVLFSAPTPTPAAPKAKASESDLSYGTCPDCGIYDHPDTTRERRPNGNTSCGACGNSTPSHGWVMPEITPRPNNAATKAELVELHEAPITKVTNEESSDALDKHFVAAVKPNGLPTSAEWEVFSLVELRKSIRDLSERLKLIPAAGLSVAYRDSVDRSLWDAVHYIGKELSRVYSVDDRAGA